MLLDSVVHFIHKLYFLLLLVGDGLRLGQRFALFSFFCTALGDELGTIWLGVFSLGIYNTGWNGWKTDYCSSNLPEKFNFNAR